MRTKRKATEDAKLESNPKKKRKDKAVKLKNVKSDVKPNEEVKKVKDENMQSQSKENADQSKSENLQFSAINNRNEVLHIIMQHYYALISAQLILQ